MQRHNMTAHDAMYAPRLPGIWCRADHPDARLAQNTAPDQAAVTL